MNQNEMQHWQIVHTVSGGVRIDDMQEDCPIMTFHGVKAQEYADTVMRGLMALVTYNDVPW